MIVPFFLVLFVLFVLFDLFELFVLFFCEPFLCRCRCWPWTEAQLLLVPELYLYLNEVQCVVAVSGLSVTVNSVKMFISQCVHM